MEMSERIPPERGKLIGQGRTAEIYAWGDDQVLKLYRAGWQGSWAEHEARISQLISTTGLPVPAVGGVIEIDGRHGVVFKRIIGSSLVQQFAAKPWTLGRALRAFTDLHLAMHAQVISDLPSQREQLARLIGDASPVPDGVRATALKRLDQLSGGNALCHGDYHPDNVLMTRNGPIIIDWGNASSGHPLADVARTALLLQVGELPSSQVNRRLLASARAFVRRAYIRRYLRLRPASKEELAAWRLPIAVARLGEGIVEERAALLRLIEAALSKVRDS
jgi:aminoglycoside phosphotransferase (APT) family kinase protein